ncbi:MAG: DUF4974 domain-containing protein [Arachidicoccus sp.]|nr:DUF4974 domain-containing protein [Arachidicoccus sp.]
MKYSGRLDELIFKYANNTISEIELNEFLEIVSAEHKKSLIENAFRKIWEGNKEVMPIYSEEKWDELYNKYLLPLIKKNIVQQEAGGERTPLNILKSITFLRIAASLVILCISVICTYLFLQKDRISTQKNKVKEQTTKVHAIMHGGDNAVLTLSNGQQINLNNVSVGKIASQQNISITKTKDGQVIFSYDSSVKKQALSLYASLNKISTPRGGKYQINLPDGTHVWLNALTTLSFPTTFSGNTRSVKLSGEAYFEVAKNPAMPFIVESGTQKVKVLGTHFDVCAYDDELMYKTTLLEGKVEVSSGNNKVVIRPGQQARLKGIEIKVADVDVEESIDWKNNFIDFNNEDIRSVMRKISRWYDADIQYQGNISGTKLSGSVSRDSDISRILDVLEATGTVHFKIQKRRIIVMP